jgi:hypothetical protein
MAASSHRPVEDDLARRRREQLDRLAAQHRAVSKRH